jgi:hemolysin activation/secretion protein
LALAKPTPFLSNDLPSTYPSNVFDHPESHPKLHSNIVVKTKTGTQVHGDAQKMNVLQLNATRHETFLTQDAVEFKPNSNRENLSPISPFHYQAAQSTPTPENSLELSAIDVERRDNVPPPEVRRQGDGGIGGGGNTGNSNPKLPTPDSPLSGSTAPPALGVKVKVKRVEVLGSTVFSPEDLEAAVASFIGKDVTFEELLSIRTAVTQLYTDNGYTTSGAFLPPQDVTEGVIKIQVVEGALERIDIQGLRHLRTSYLGDRIRLAAKVPVNIRRLEEALQLLKLNPLISNITAELSAGTAPGLSVLSVNVQEAKPLTTALIVENTDSPSVGEIRGTASINHNNLLGFGDHLNAEYHINEGVNRYNISYQIPINARDSTLSFSYINSDSRIIEPPFAAIDINAKSYNLSFGFQQPIIHTPTKELSLSLSLDLRQNQTFLLTDVPFSFIPGPENGKSRITALRFAQEWMNRSPTQVFAARSQFSFGLDALGATINNIGVDGRFITWMGQLQWVQSLGRDAILIARAGSQLSFNSLLPIEQFNLGGLDTVRGYRQNQLIGDNAAFGSVEVRFPIIRNPDGIGTIQISPFFDIGTVWNHQGEITGPHTIASIGLGLSWQLDPYFLARVDWGLPLNPIRSQANTLQDNGFTFSIRFQPFSF